MPTFQKKICRPCNGLGYIGTKNNESDFLKVCTTCNGIGYRWKEISKQPQNSVVHKDEYGNKLP